MSINNPSSLIIWKTKLKDHSIIVSEVSEGLLIQKTGEADIIIKTPFDGSLTEQLYVVDRKPDAVIINGTYNNDRLWTKTLPLSTVQFEGWSQLDGTTKLKDILSAILNKRPPEKVGVTQFMYDQLVAILSVNNEEV
jgi:hypothetical protein